ncbi:MAG TPA: hypothetical protein VNN76_00555 [Bacteroidota bacterium]|nr:hypothetical protein [Bacteroidota bacterium]
METRDTGFCGISVSRRARMFFIAALVVSSLLLGSASVYYNARTQQVFDDEGTGTLLSLPQ